ncbi:MAG: sigma-70 family RNA polymerase sigma factor [Gammaproteobacteria bacterium]|nr:sigma-70 family RNA polymerase sigma factor [Gammaproteobacteria bacterium]
MAEPGRLIDAYIALRGQIARLVMRIVPPKEVEDIVQETYVRICRVDNQDAIREPRSYVFRTARNLALDHVKRSESRLTGGTDMDDLPAEDSLLPSELDPTYAQVASDEEFALFCEAVRSLPRQCRRAFVLKKVYGFTLKEIMAEMDLGQATVETHIVNGTKKCVQYLRERREGRRLPVAGASRNTSRHSSKGRRGEGA